MRDESPTYVQRCFRWDLMSYAGIRGVKAVTGGNMSPWLSLAIRKVH